jgi:hypothetical protein
MMAVMDQSSRHPKEYTGDYQRRKTKDGEFSLFPDTLFCRAIAKNEVSSLKPFLCRIMSCLKTAGLEILVKDSKKGYSCNL